MVAFLLHFHTIQSILKRGASGKIVIDHYTFPYYSVYFKACVMLTVMDEPATHFHTIQSILKQEFKEFVNLYLEYFHTIQSILKQKLQICLQT